MAAVPSATFRVAVLAVIRTRSEPPLKSAESMSVTVIWLFVGDPSFFVTLSKTAPTGSAVLKLTMSPEMAVNWSAPVPPLSSLMARTPDAIVTTGASFTGVKFAV